MCENAAKVVLISLKSKTISAAIIAASTTFAKKHNFHTLKKKKYLSATAKMFINVTKLSIL